MKKKPKVVTTIIALIYILKSTAETYKDTFLISLITNKIISTFHTSIQFVNMTGSRYTCPVFLGTLSF